MSGIQIDTVNVTGDGEAERIRGSRVSSAAWMPLRRTLASGPLEALRSE